MKSTVAIVLLFFNLSEIVKVKAFVDLNWDPNNPVFDPKFYEDLLDEEKCETQLAYITNNNTFLRLQFIEPGIRIPRGILTGNTVDLGNYHQCLGISQDIGSSMIEGKYCMIDVPLTQANLPSILDFDSLGLQISENVERMQKFQGIEANAFRAIRGNGMINSRLDSDTGGLGNVQFKLALCVPKVCTTKQGIDGILFNLSAVGFQYTDDFCRVLNDKQWVPVDYISIVLLCIIALLTILSTTYDLWNVFKLKSDPKSISTLGRSFSLYTNARRLTTFTSSPDTLECLDGIRAISMAWVIVGHTVVSLPPMINILDMLQWLTSLRSLWITAAPITVDTFFLMTGLLVVYSTTGKMNGKLLLKNLHLYYLHRFLRMFPLLLAIILLQASLLNHVSDGPQWNQVASQTDACRTYWWSTLLYVQNYVPERSLCLGHTWYLAIDMQLHILSPLVLFWVLSGNKKAAWIAMTAGLLAFQVSATTFNFVMELPGALVHISRINEILDYTNYYYFNTLTRAAPFFVGMMYGYLLHSCRGKKIEISKALAVILWVCALTLTSVTFYATEPMKSMDWNNQTVDSLVNSFMRPAWALAIGWIVFACVHGYGGPVNWFLSLKLWKLLSRISLGMYLFHFPMMFVISGTTTAPIFFSEAYILYTFVCMFVLSFLVSFFATLIIDSPITIIVKLFMPLDTGSGPIQPQKVVPDVNGTVKENETKMF